YAADVVRQRAWPRKLKWLRAAGVTSVVASDVPPGTEGLTPIFVEASAGVPVTLWKLDAALTGTRRAGRVVVTSSIDATVVASEDAGFEPAPDVVLAAKDASLGSSERDPSAEVHVVAEGPDRLVLETSGSLRGILRVDRSFTPAAEATVDGRKAIVYPAD